MCSTIYFYANHGGREISSVGLKPLGCCDYGFESRWVCGCSSHVLGVCCVVSDLCDELITRSEESYRVFMCVCVCLIVHDLETWTLKRPMAELFCCTTKKKKSFSRECSSVSAKIQTQSSVEVGKAAVSESETLLAVDHVTLVMWHTHTHNPPGPSKLQSCVA